MKLWIDDVRPMPDDYDVWAKNYREAIAAIQTETVTEISFDHDLGEFLTGYDIAKYIMTEASWNGIPPIKWHIHSMNPVGKNNIECAMKNAEYYWNNPNWNNPDDKD